MRCFTYFKNLLIRFYQTKVGSFFERYHLFYLLLPFAIWGLKAGIYNLAILINPNPQFFHFAIDDQIPFCKYFVLFYISYYFMPPILLWMMSFYHKGRYWRSLIALGICVLICFLTYCCYNVQMIRPEEYPNGIGITDVNSISTFFDFCINWVYSLDPTGMNCFPSLHCIVGSMCIMLGVSWTMEDDKKLPLWGRILAIIEGLGCILSTIFIKQHYFLDLVVGIVIFVVIYMGLVLLARCKKNKQLSIEKGE